MRTPFDGKAGSLIFVVSPFSLLASRATIVRYHQADISHTWIYPETLESDGGRRNLTQISLAAQTMGRRIRGLGVALGTNLHVSASE